jgi:hypothetical protein
LTALAECSADGHANGDADSDPSRHVVYRSPNHRAERDPKPDPNAEVPAGLLIRRLLIFLIAHRSILSSSLKSPG